MALKVDNSDMIINISEDEHGDLYVPESSGGVKIVEEDKGVHIEKNTKGDISSSPKDTGIKKGTEGTILVDERMFDEGDETDDFNFEKDEEEVEPVKQTKTTKPSGKKGSFDGDAYAAFAEELRNSGFLPDVTDEELKEIKDTKTLAEIFGKQLQMVAGSYREEILQDMVDNLIKEGVIKKSDVVDDLQEDKFTMDRFNGDEDKMKSYLESYYKRKGLSDKMIKKQLESIVDYEDVIVEALEDDSKYVAEKKKQLADKYVQEKEAKKKAELTFQQELEKNTLERDEFIPGRKVTNPTKKKVLDNIPRVIQRINTEGTKLLPLLAYLESIGVLDGKWDEILKVGESKATDRLSEALKGPKKARYSEEVNPDIEALRRIAFESLPNYKR